MLCEDRLGLNLGLTTDFKTRNYNFLIERALGIKNASFDYCRLPLFICAPEVPVTVRTCTSHSVLPSRFYTFNEKKKKNFPTTDPQ
jgi:hypothetical protein